MSEIVSSGGCACGAVRFTARGKPLRSGLCHCRTCQRAQGSAYFPFVVFAPDQVAFTGSVASWKSTPAYDRRYCPACGSRFASINPDAVELATTSFDETGLFPPQYESWTIRRQPWIKPLDVPQYDRDRPDDTAS